MKKLLSTLVLTVAVCGPSFAEETLSIQQAPIAMNLKVMEKSAILGCGDVEAIKDASKANLTRVDSRDKLVADVDSDDEESEVQDMMKRQSSQENLAKPASQEQYAGWRARVYNTLVSVKNMFVNALKTVKSWIW